MTYYIVEAHEKIADKDDITASLKRAGIHAHVNKPSLDNIAPLVVEAVGTNRTMEESEQILRTLSSKIGCMIDDEGEADYERMIQSIDAMEKRYGELVTFRAARNCVAIDMPLSLVSQVKQSEGVDYDIALHKLAGLLVPQLDRLSPSMLQTVLGDSYTAKRSDYITLVKKACAEIENAA